MSWAEVALLSLAAFVGTVVLTRPLIGFLARRQLGKVIRADGPAHQAKAGTPTMGGLGVLAVVAVVSLYVFSRREMYLAHGGPSSDGTLVLPAPHFGLLLLAPAIAMAAYGLLGAVDDWQGLARKGRARELGVGITARHMILAQVLIATVMTTLVVGSLSSEGLSDLLEFGNAGAGLLVVMGVVAIVGTVNGVNMSDGLDGLAAGLLAIAFAGLAAVTAIAFASSGYSTTNFATGLPIVPPTAALALPVAAACLGFLLFNRHPARVFMGNVTSYGLGALLAMLFLLSDPWYLLPIIGAVFVAEVVSDIIQVGYFKYSGGRRVFRMAPIHHHFELGGWPETKVVTRFWLFGLVAALAGVALAATLARP